jgi:hypothetical protein
MDTRCIVNFGHLRNQKKKEKEGIIEWNRCPFACKYYEIQMKNQENVKKGKVASIKLPTESDNMITNEADEGYTKNIYHTKVVMKKHVVTYSDNERGENKKDKKKSPNPDDVVRNFIYKNV